VLGGSYHLSRFTVFFGGFNIRQLLVNNHNNQLLRLLNFGYAALLIACVAVNNLIELRTCDVRRESRVVKPITCILISSSPNLAHQSEAVFTVFTVRL